MTYLTGYWYPGPCCDEHAKKPKKQQTQFNEVVLSMLKLHSFCTGENICNDDQGTNDDDDDAATIADDDDDDI